MSPAQIDLTRVEARIESLERTNRRMKFALAGVGLAAVALAAGGFARPAQDSRREITTERLIIKGPDNQPRIMLTGTGKGSSLFLYGPEKHSEPAGGGNSGENSGGAAAGVTGFTMLKPRMRILVTEDDSRIQMIDSRGRERMVLTVDKEGRPGVIRYDEDGNEIE